MKANVLAVVISLGVTLAVSAQGPLLRLGPDLTLQMFVATNGCYQIESSTNLLNWGALGTYIVTPSTPYTKVVEPVTNNNAQFFRAVWSVAAYNGTYLDNCAEDDNVNVALIGEVTNFSIIATHATTYQPTNYTCLPNFTNCQQGTNVDYSFTPFTEKTDFGAADYIIANRSALWWRPQGMTYTVNGYFPKNDIHYVQIGKKIPGTSEWPQYFVLYSDGNMRLIPFPTVGHSSVCFGSSVVIGPAPISVRPFAEIETLDIRTTTPNYLHVTYRSGGSADIYFNNVSRTSATVNVSVKYQTDQSFCTFRSMFVSDGNSDCDNVWWKDLYGQVGEDHILAFTGIAGTEWLFNRKTISVHNQSAPDIRIVVH